MQRGYKRAAKKRSAQQRADYSTIRVETGNRKTRADCHTDVEKGASVPAMRDSLRAALWYNRSMQAHCHGTRRFRLRGGFRVWTWWK